MRYLIQRDEIGMRYHIPSDEPDFSEALLPQVRRMPDAGGYCFLLIC